MTKTPTLAITAMAGIYPGASDLEAYWQNILTAKVAPLTNLASQWPGDVTKSLFTPFAQFTPGNTYNMYGFCLPPEVEPLLQERHPDRQIAAGLLVLERLKEAYGSFKQTALVAGMSWASPSYHDAETRRLLGPLRPGHLEPSQGSATAGPAEQITLLGLGFGGPILAVDTACSSSLYSLIKGVHLIRSGAAEAAVILGLSVWHPLPMYVGFSLLGAFDPEQKIAPFSKNAKGILLGEGAGAIAIEPIERAEAAGRPILAIVESFGISADGRERSLFAPGLNGQKLALDRAWSGHLAGQAPDYLEAHGTGTPAGDSTEIAALGAFFRGKSPEAIPLGSVKSLIGHSLAASGLAAMIKSVLMLQKGQMPPHIGAEPHPALVGSGLGLLAAVGGKAPQRIGVSGCGFGGGNAHIVLQRNEADSEATTAPPFIATEELGSFSIVDASFTFGAGQTNSEVAGLLARNRLAPEERYLPEKLVFNFAGLNMGSKSLGRLDPYQLLLVAKTRALVSRHPHLGHGEGGAVMLHGLLGGHTFQENLLRVVARTLPDTESPNAIYGSEELCSQEDYCPESIIGSLPALNSGTPAFLFDQKGFHESVAGPRGHLWDSLCSVPQYLKHHASHLFFGGGRLIKSPAEEAARPLPGEGAGLLLLTAVAENALADVTLVRSDSPLADLLTKRGLKLEAFDLVLEVTPETPGFFGDFGDCAGLELWPEILVRTKARALVRVVRPGYKALTLIIEKKRALPEEALSRSGLTLAFPRRLRWGQTRAAPSPALSDLMNRCTGNLWLTRQFLASSQRLMAPRAPWVAAAPQRQILEEKAVHGERDLVGRRLLVDESHPYFFDHPLDHVPGILLIAGVCELLRRHSADTAYLSFVRFGFTRFCEKDPLPHILAVSSSPPAEPRGHIRQEGKTVASWHGRLKERQGPMTVAPQLPLLKKPEAKWLHKQRAENILVSELRQIDGKMPSCRFLPPEPGHYLAAQDAFTGVLYVLECARQFLMLVAHQVMAVPLGQPINLLSFELELNRPVYAGGRIDIFHASQLALGQEQTPLLTCGLLDERGDLGQVRMRAQLMNQERYQNLRAGTDG